MKLEVRESQIEDVFVSAGVLTRRILNLEDEPRLLVRQMILPSGRLDLLYAYQTKLLLIELKAVKFKRDFLDQVLNYKNELLEYQQRGKLLQGDIESFLLCTEATSLEKSLAEKRGVNLTKYDPQEVLGFFYKNFKPIAFFTKTKPIDIGIWNLHLVHEFIYLLEQTNSVIRLRELIGGSQKTLYNKIKFAFELRLINWLPNQDKVSLTNLGKQYVQSKDKILSQRMSEEQAELLRRFVIQNPYESSVILGIAAVVESVFALSKNTYPVPMGHLIEYFAYFAGKYFDWQTPKAKFNATRMYSNYAVDLGLLAKTDNTVYLTPEGFRFTVQMQLHKSFKMVESLRVF
ncbi:MAG: hypothetical protein Q7K35_01005 [bacterium]|nr:hypothetical protein [bacterium]